MSLINDALKRVEQSLNDNSPDQRFPNKMPSYPMEPSGRNKKLFFIAVVGGTLFFSILILLLVLIFSGSSSPSSALPPSPTPSSTNAMISHTQESKEEKKSSIEPSSIPSLQQTDNLEENPSDSVNSIEPQEASKNESPDVTVDSKESPSSDTIPNVPTSDNSNDKDLNEEFFESVVNLASKAFTLDPKKSKTNNSTESNKDKNENRTEENFTLSTAQSTLDKIQRESELQKEAPRSRVQEFIDSLAVTGVMISKDESMALINNRVFSKNSIVDSKFNLTLIEIQPQKIVLKDGTGTTYDVDF